MSNRLAVLATVAVLASSQAMADEAPGAAVDWGVVSGRTVGSGSFVIHPEFGWPGLGSAFIYGAGSAFDVGGRFTFNYGHEGGGAGFGVAIVPQIKLNGLMKFKLLDRDKFSLALSTEPGVAFFFVGGVSGMQIYFPVYMSFGIHPAPQVGIVLGADLPFNIGFLFQGGNPFFQLPMGFGPGVEFAIAPNLQLTFNLRFGPGIIAGGAGSTAGFAFKTLMGIAIKL